MLEEVILSFRKEFTHALRLQESFNQATQKDRPGLAAYMQRMDTLYIVEIVGQLIIEQQAQLNRINNVLQSKLTFLHAYQV